MEYREAQNLADRWWNTVFYDLAWPCRFIKKQVNLVRAGVRDGRLHDETCHLVRIADEHPIVLDRLSNEIVAS